MENIPRLISNVLTPEIIWYQTDVSIVVKIVLTNVADYYLSVSMDYFLFSTIVDGKDYFVCVKFFGAIEPEKTKHINLDREVRLYIVKAHKWVTWFRLQQNEEYNPLIVHDADHVGLETAWRNCLSSGLGIGLGGRGVTFEEYKHINCITNILPEGSTDEEESDDETVDAVFDCYL